MERKSQNFVTVLTRILEHKTHEELEALDRLIYTSLGNLKQSTVEKLDAINLIHFASMNVIKGHVEEEPSYILLEMTVDGDPEIVIKKFVETFPEDLKKIYRHADTSLTSIAALTRQLLDDQYKIKRSPIPALFEPQSINGLPFSGTSGLDLNDVADDSKIADFAQAVLHHKKVRASQSTPSNPEDCKKGLENEGINDEPNQPLDIFRHVKKSLIEQANDPELAYSWNRATSRKQSPNFAESMDSNWKENWSQFKLFASIVPTWIWACIGVIYLMILMLIKDQSLRWSENAERLLPDPNCPAWDTIRYTGSPFFKSNAPLPKCLSLEPFFLVQGMLFSILVFAVLRYSPIATKRPAISLTLLTGMALYLLFPQTIDINQFNGALASIDMRNSAYMLIAFLAGLYVMLLLIHKLPKIKIFKGLSLRLAKGFNRIHHWVYFSLAIGLCVLFLHLGQKFFHGHDLGGFILRPIRFFLSLFTTIDMATAHTPVYEFAHQFCQDTLSIPNAQQATQCLQKGAPPPTQFIFVTAAIAMIFTLSLHAVLTHAPRRVRQAIGLFPFPKKLSIWLKVNPVKAWFAVFCIIALIVFDAAFVDASYTLSNGLQVMGRVCIAAIAAVISMLIFKLLSPGKINAKIAFIGFFIAWSLLLSSRYFFSDVAVTNYIYILTAVPITIVITAITVLIILGFFLKSQNKNLQRYDSPYTDITKQMFDRESKVNQNHMISIQRLIPTALRKNIALPLMLHAIYGVLTKQRFRPGFLANVGTVHSARWIHIPDTDNYVFLGNYDGSFESYLEDFSKMAVEGTNLAWGNCIGFPKIKGIFKGGVEDSDRFRRYARRSMKPTAFWYSAVSNKSAEQIRRNALIRDGLTQDNLSASEAQAWLDLFSSIPRPEWVLETDEIQNIMFGGNGGLRHGACYALKQNTDGTPSSPSALAEWVSTIRSHVTFTEKPQSEKSTYVAFSALGLRALGLDNILDEPFKQDEHHKTPDPSDSESAVNFSQPFVSGMADPSRRNILGDHGDNDPEKWNWSDKTVYAVILVYAHNNHSLNTEVEALKPNANSGLVLNKIKTFKQKTGKNIVDREPFGFADGISQPILKGTARGRKHTESIHLVDAGEFILGYRDNRGHFPPSPVIDAKHDISDLLPNGTTDLIQKYPNFGSANRSSHRSLGRNGSYLVIRELLQDVEGFHAMSEKAAKAIVTQNVRRLSPQPFISLHIDAKENDTNKGNNLSGPRFSSKEKKTIKNYANWIEYLLMGRHKNGTSLIDKPIKIEQVAGKPIKFSGEISRPKVHRDSRELKQENEFLFKDTDPQGHKCPFGSHVRRANPRDGLMLETKDGLAVAQRHRILRRGRSYGEDGDAEKGTFFMCLNSDIDRQFEFLQQTWLLSSKFHGLRDEIDPIAGQTDSKKEGSAYFSIQHPDGDIRIEGLQNFVTMKGGGYFFLPGKSCLDFFASLKEAPLKDT